MTWSQPAITGSLVLCRITREVSFLPQTAGGDASLFIRPCFQDKLCLPLLSCTRSWLDLQVLTRQLEWSSFSESENESHSSWVTASFWSPGLKGCGPGWTGWFCPCTVADVSWFPPAPSGPPLTGEKVCQIHFHFTIVLLIVLSHKSSLFNLWTLQYTVGNIKILSVLRHIHSFVHILCMESLFPWPWPAGSLCVICTVDSNRQWCIISNTIMLRYVLEIHLCSTCCI